MYQMHTHICISNLRQTQYARDCVAMSVSRTGVGATQVAYIRHQRVRSTQQLSQSVPLSAHCRRLRMLKHSFKTAKPRQQENLSISQACHFLQTAVNKKHFNTSYH